MKGLAVGVLLGAAMALAACHSAPDDPNVEACRAEAEQDPAVHSLMLKSAGSPYFMLNNQDELAQARKQATLACLQRRGLAPPGGVEPHRPGT